MPRYTVKIKDRYFHWSTIVDAPITDGMSREEFCAWYLKEYGVNHRFKNMMDLLEKYPAVNGNAVVMAETMEDAISGNRAGENGEYLTADEIYEQYKPKEAL